MNAQVALMAGTGEPDAHSIAEQVGDGARWARTMMDTGLCSEKPAWGIRAMRWT